MATIDKEVKRLLAQYLKTLTWREKIMADNLVYQRSYGAGRIWSTKGETKAEWLEEAERTEKKLAKVRADMAIINKII